MKTRGVAGMASVISFFFEGGLFLFFLSISSSALLGGKEVNREDMRVK